MTITEWPPGTPPPATSITGEIFWLYPDGSEAKTVAVGRLVKGTVRVNVPPIEPGLHWGVRLTESGQPGPVFRSGLLDSLPTGRIPPMSPSDGSISVVRESFRSDSLFSPGFRLRARIAGGLMSVPGAERSAVVVRAISEGWEVDVLSVAYRFRQPFDLLPATDVGRPEVVIEASPRGPGTIQGSLPLVRPSLRADLRASIRRSLERFFASYVYFLPSPPFTPTTFSVSYVRGFLLNGQLELRLNGGRVNGPPNVMRASPGHRTSPAGA